MKKRKSEEDMSKLIIRIDINNLSFIKHIIINKTLAIKNINIFFLSKIIYEILSVYLEKIYIKII